MICLITWLTWLIMNHVININESCAWISHVPHIYDAHVNESRHIYLTYMMDESCRWLRHVVMLCSRNVTSLTWTSHVAHANESRHAYMTQKHSQRHVVCGSFICVVFLCIKCMWSVVFLCIKGMWSLVFLCIKCMWLIHMCSVSMYVQCMWSVVFLHITCMWSVCVYQVYVTHRLSVFRMYSVSIYRVYVKCMCLIQICSVCEV